MQWPQFMKRETVAVFFDTSPQTVDRWVKDGAIPAPHIIGGSKRWDLDELRAAARDALSGKSGVGSTDPDRAMEAWKDGRKNSQKAA